MNLGKPLKVVMVPERVPAQQPVKAPPQTQPNPLIPLPADWPIRHPAEQPRPAGRMTP